jgi:hypothetical protein
VRDLRVERAQVVRLLEHGDDDRDRGEKRHRGRGGEDTSPRRVAQVEGIPRRARTAVRGQIARSFQIERL